MKYKRILFLLFIFSALGFLFFNTDIASAADGVCTCEVINTDTGEIGIPKDVVADSQDACSESDKKSPSDGFMYDNCLWQFTDDLQASVSGGESAPPLDLPSVEGLKQLNISGSDTKTVMQKLFGNIIYVAMGLLGSIALALFAYAGVLWMLSGGNSEQATKARNIVVWAVLGLFVIFASYTIVSFIFSAVE